MSVKENPDRIKKAEEPLIHIFCHSTLRLYRSLLSRFTLPKVISESVNNLSIVLEEPDVLKYFNSIFIGAINKQYARESEIIGASEYKKILKKSNGFFHKSAKYLQKSMPVLKTSY